MNILELYDALRPELGIDIAGLDVVRVEKLANLKRRLDPDLDVNVTAQLVSVLREDRDMFIFVANTRLLFNFLTGKDYRQHHFSEVPEPDTDAVRRFVNRYLADDLEARFDRKLTQSEFSDLADVLTVKRYFPSELFYRIEKRLHAKLDFAIARLSPSPDHNAGIGFLNRHGFYECLSHVASVETDNKVSTLINRTAQIFNSGHNKAFVSGIMASMRSTMHSARSSMTSSRAIRPSTIPGRSRAPALPPGGAFWWLRC